MRAKGASEKAAKAPAPAAPAAPPPRAPPKEEEWMLAGGSPAVEPEGEGGGKSRFAGLFGGGGEDTTEAEPAGRSRFARLSFALLSEAELEDAGRRLGGALAALLPPTPTE